MTITPTSSIFTPNPNPSLTLTEAQQANIAAQIPEHPDGDPVQFQMAATGDGRTAFIVGQRGIILATGTLGADGRVDFYQPRKALYRLQALNA
jgi:hypothetical protein